MRRMRKRARGRIKERNKERYESKEGKKKYRTIKEEKMQEKGMVEFGTEGDEEEGK